MYSLFSEEHANLIKENKKDAPPITEEPKQDIEVLLIEKTIVLEDDTEPSNQSLTILIEDSDVNFSLPATEERELSFWQNGFTIGVHVSPLAMLLFTAVLVLFLGMRLALKFQKKRLHAHTQPMTKHSFDNDSLKTISTTQ
jgi:hypothetical protein